MTSHDDIRPIIPALAPLYRGLSGLSYPMIRFFTGLILMPHGAQKLFGWFGGNIQGTAGFFAEMGLEPALPLAYLVGGIEFFGGLFLAIGFLTRPAAAAIAVVMAVAMFKVHLGNGFFWGGGGYEYPMLWGLIALALAFRGGGELSLDKAIGREF
ncbi:MAG: DoxX family protein [Rhodospirillales bacterium]|nr:DoxX family protein [Rhodospirillales bacterium]